MNGSSLPSHSSDTAVHWLNEVWIDTTEEVWSNNRNVAPSIYSDLTGIAIDCSQHSEAVTSSINRTSLENVTQIIVHRGYSVTSRALPRKLGYCPFPGRVIVRSPGCPVCSRGHSRFLCPFSLHSQQIRPLGAGRCDFREFLPRRGSLPHCCIA